jgi:hypothetical protein
LRFSLRDDVLVNRRAAKCAPADVPREVRGERRLGADVGGAACGATITSRSGSHSFHEHTTELEAGSERSRVERVLLSGNSVVLYAADFFRGRPPFLPFSGTAAVFRGGCRSTLSSDRRRGVQRQCFRDQQWNG